MIAALLMLNFCCISTLFRVLSIRVPETRYCHMVKPFQVKRNDVPAATVQRRTHFVAETLLALEPEDLR